MNNSKSSLAHEYSVTPGRTSKEKREGREGGREGGRGREGERERKEEGVCGEGRGGVIDREKEDKGGDRGRIAYKYDSKTEPQT